MGGHGAGVTEQLKYRRSQLAKPKTHKRSYVFVKKEKWVDPKEATLEQLLEIRRRIQKQEKRRHWLTLGLTAMIILSGILAIVYLL